MSSNDPTHTRERFATLLAGQNAQLAALEDLLKQEYALLEARRGSLTNWMAHQQGDRILLLDENAATGRATGLAAIRPGAHLLACATPPASDPRCSKDASVPKLREQNDRNGSGHRRMHARPQSDVLNAGTRRIRKAPERQDSGYAASYYAA